MTDKPRAYIAGPHVFLQAGHPLRDRMDAACVANGLLPVHPFDGELDAPSLVDRAARIAAENERLIRGADVVVANASPFRGPSMDVGTAYEVGFARALGIPVVCWSCTATEYVDRVERDGGSRYEAEGLVDRDGLLIENFGLPENLMLATAANSWSHAGETGPWWDDAFPFASAVAKAAVLLKVRDRIARRGASER